MSSTDGGQKISASATVVTAKDKISADLADETVILDLTSGTYYGLDALGTRIWSSIQEPRTVSDVRDVLLDEYEVDPDRCERELVAFLRDLAAQGLIETKDA
jgi:hypothetical protein